MDSAARSNCANDLDRHVGTDLVEFAIVIAGLLLAFSGRVLGGVMRASMLRKVKRQKSPRR